MLLLLPTGDRVACGQDAEAHQHVTFMSLDIHATHFDGLASSQPHLCLCKLQALIGQLLRFNTPTPWPLVHTHTHIQVRHVVTRTKPQPITNTDNMCGYKNTCRLAHTRVRNVSRSLFFCWCLPSTYECRGQTQVRSHVIETISVPMHAKRHTCI